MYQVGQHLIWQSAQTKANFVQGVFVQAAADNDDLVEEHATHLEHESPQPTKVI